VSTSGGLCPCASGGATLFDVGTIIIPMDACYQRGKDITTLPSYCNANAKQVGDDSPLKAYGLVFFPPAAPGDRLHGDRSQQVVDRRGRSIARLVRHPDFAGARYDWATGNVVSLPDTSIYTIAYRGAPFLIDASQHDRVLDLLKKRP